MRKTHYITFILILPLLGACTKGQGISLRQYEYEKPTYQSFKLCHGYSCTMRTDISITEDQWQTITAHLETPAETAAQERENITLAIAEIERIVTQNANMTPDRAKAENFEMDDHQMDCIDETINTSRYLKFLAKNKPFIFHTVDEPIHRGYLIDGVWPHNTATVKEIKTGKIYAIDTFYKDNGNPPYIVPKNIWLGNWKPDET